jgi:FAD/FMN-containing dehydrogenase/Fe-S oxidoreductase
MTPQGTEPAAGMLEADLRRAVRGEVRFDDGSRALYATDASNYRQVPIGVVVPADVDDVLATVEACREHGAPILARGGGTSLAGQCCNVAVVIDCSKHLNRVLGIDPDRRVARVQPGVVLDDLAAQAKDHGLMFAPDPATHASCTFGGMIGNNACGVHSVMAGRVEDNLVELDVVLADGTRLTVGPTTATELDAVVAVGGRRGEIYAALRALRDRTAAEVRARFPDIPRRVSGYNLDELLPEGDFHVARALAGTEGTCAFTLEAAVRLVPRPPTRSLVVLGYPGVAEAADDVPVVLETGPIGLEGIDDVLVSSMRAKGMHVEDLSLLPEGRGWLLVEFGGETREEANAGAQALVRALGRRGESSTALFDRPEQQRVVWEIRESALGAIARVPGRPDTWEGWEDSAVAPERLGVYLRELQGLYERYGYHGALYGHFGQGCVHTRTDFDLITEPGVRRFRSFLDEAADLVVSMGGSLSGEHGDGQSRAELLPRMFGDDLVKAFGEFKAIWDPEGRMNPGKVVDPYPITSDLRLGPEYRPPKWSLAFAYPTDDGDLSRATLRCVGVGKCRKLETGVMCPSFMVTREEMHSTRGRARLLFEMLRGDPVREGWRDRHVREALDLCLGCKACRTECPVNVDIATYKAEFMSHHHRGRLRPRPAYALGLIAWWARLGSRVPGPVNRVLRSPAIGTGVRRAAGLAPERAAPPFAPVSFRRWFRRREDRRPPGTGPPVVLFPDTFNDHFHPAALASAVRLLEGTGHHVVVPRPWVCCGRPLYDYGMLTLARSVLRRVVEVLGPKVKAGVPVVSLEPSCVAVFRDELMNLFPDDPVAERLSAQTFTLAEFLARAGYEPPRLSGRALVQRHCHHQAVMGFGPDRDLLDATGLDVEILDSGCCGLAGSFGFEAGEKYEVSMRCGERRLFPAVRREAGSTTLVADGFSCREQILHGTGRRAVHLAQLLAGGTL